MINKDVSKTKHTITSEIGQVLGSIKQPESYLFLGKAYYAAFDEVVNSVSYINRCLIEIYSVYAGDSDFYEAVDSCTRQNNIFVGGRLVVLLLKNRGEQYQTSLLVPLERLTLPLLVFADNDNLGEPFMSRIAHVYKQSNENLQISGFLPPNKLLSRPSIGSAYKCPTLIKLADYSSLSASDKKADVLISKLSGGNVYPEVLSGLQPPIQSFRYDVQLETLSLLKNRID